MTERCIIIYDPVTRLIQSTVDQPYPEGIFDAYQSFVNQNPDFAYLEVDKPLVGLHAVYVANNGEVLMRDHLTVTTTVNAVVGGSIVIDNIPPHTKIVVDGVEATNGEETLVEIEFDTSGVYQIDLLKFPYLPKTITVNVP